MINFAHEGHPHVDGAAHVSGGNTLGLVILLSLAVVVVGGFIFFALKNKK
jgi:hypothetical protein